MPGGLGAVWVVTLESGAVLLAAGLAEVLVSAGFFAAGFFAAAFFSAGFLAAFFFMARNLQQVLRVRQFSGPPSPGALRANRVRPGPRRHQRGRAVVGVVAAGGIDGAAAGVVGRPAPGDGAS
jgi:hypothetical protein